MTAVVVAGGGLGASTTAAVLGIMVAPFLVAPVTTRARSAPLVPALAASALAWTALSLVWSPYERPDQALKLLLLTPLFALVVVSAARTDDRSAALRLRWAAGAVLAVSAYFLIELASGGAIATWAKMTLEGHGPRAYAASLGERTLARGLTGHVLIAGPVAAALLSRRQPVSNALAGLIAAVAVTGAVTFNVTANTASIFAGAAAAGLAWRYGGQALGALCFIVAGSIAAAPLYMAAITLLTGEETAAALPLSWHMRLEIWRFTLEQISAAPVFGHGLDASRVLGEAAELRGVAYDRLPLHPHNHGLQIWLETGFAGAALFSAAAAALGWRCMGAKLDPVTAAGVAFCVAAYLTTVAIGSGVWQEWLHGCLAIGLATAFLVRR